MLLFILDKMSFSNTLDTVERREIGRYEETSLGDLLGFRMGIIRACFHMGGNML